MVIETDDKPVKLKRVWVVRNLPICFVCQLEGKSSPAHYRGRSFCADHPVNMCPQHFTETAVFSGSGHPSDQAIQLIDDDHLNRMMRLTRGEL